MFACTTGRARSSAVTLVVAGAIAIVQVDASAALLNTFAVVVY